MLKNIPPILSPDLLYVLANMGHGDEIIIADGNFPADSSTDRLIRCDGHGVPEVLEAVLQLLPLDDFVDHPATLMKVVPGKFDQTPPISDGKARQTRAFFLFCVGLAGRP